MEIRPINEVNKKSPIVQIKDMVVGTFTLDWIFSTKLEKGILVACILWTIYSIYKFVSGLLF